MAKKFVLLSALFFFVVLSACAPKQLTREQLNQYPKMVELEKGLDRARGNDVHLLAPNHFQRALNKYIEAYTALQDGLADSVNSSVSSGQQLLKKALELEARSRKLLSEIMLVRNRAKQAGADRYYKQKFQELDERLVKVAELVENNAIEKAKKRRPDLHAAYLDIELAALKTKTIAHAKKAIRHAENNDAKKYAPKTLSNAVEELTLAQSVLDSDRTSTDKANAHAKRAFDLANRSYHISETIKEFKRQKFTQEDVVLMYQNQLTSLGQLLDETPLFNKSDGETVAELREGLKKVIDAKSQNKSTVNELRAELAETDRQYAQELALLREKYTGKITVLDKTQKHLESMQKEERARFARVQAAFTENEANVFRQGDNVLISVHGFKFPVNSSEIRPVNFALMNKIIKVIDEFKSSKVVVSGHTDSTGNSEINQRLSSDRAQSVAKFLNEVAKIPGSRIRSKGFGSEKPLASNLTPEGRAMNRRVEILIVND